MPIAIDIDPFANMIYVGAGNFGWSRLYIVNASNNEVVKFIDFDYGSRKLSIAVNPSTNFVYMANDQDHTISIIDGRTQEVVKTIKEGYAPQHIEINPKTNEVYVVISDLVSYYGTRLDELPLEEAYKTIPLLNTPIYAIVVINGMTNTLEYRLIEADRLSGITLNTKSDELYTTDYSRGDLLIIDLQHDKIKNKILNVTKRAYSIAVNEELNLVYVAGCDDLIALVDLNEGKVVEKIEPQETIGMAIHQNSGKLYGYNSKGEIFVLHDPNQKYTKNLSPLAQTKNEILPEDVSCKNGLELIFKSTDDSPACVKPKTVEKLVERGWASS